VIGVAFGSPLNVGQRNAAIVRQSSTRVDKVNANTPQLLLPGGAGFLGRLLADWFTERGWGVVILTRRAEADRPGVRHVHWDGDTLGPWRSK
jgi:hypothetical protein